MQESSKYVIYSSITFRCTNAILQHEKYLPLILDSQLQHDVEVDFDFEDDATLELSWIFPCAIPLK